MKAYYLAYGNIKQHTCRSILLNAFWLFPLKVFNETIIFQRERLANLFDRFAQQIGEDSSSLLFFLDGKSLDRTQTLLSCKIDVSKIMEARHNFTGECKLIQVSQFTNSLQPLFTVVRFLGYLAGRTNERVANPLGLRQTSVLPSSVMVNG